MKYSILLLFFVLLVSCTSDDVAEIIDYTAQNEQEILDYIESNNLDAKRSDTGLYYVINEEGTGANIAATSDISVVYKGYYTNETVFDQSDSDGVSFNLQGTIAGFSEGIQLFNEGGSGLLLIPSRLAYGNSVVNGVPGGSVLIFEVRLIDYVAENEQEILDYIAANNLDAVRSDSGLHYVIDEEGTGDQPTASSNVTVVYKGYYSDNEVFEESDQNGITAGLNQVISGWTEGITYFKEGGNGILLIPSHLGYGRYGNGSVPDGAVLIFDVELISVN